MKDLVADLLAYAKENNIGLDELSAFMDDLKCSLTDQMLEEGEEYVIKRSGSLQKFDQEKIGRSVERAAKAIDQNLNKSDTNLIISDLKNETEKLDRKVYTTAEIRKIVGDCLVKEGYKEVADSYLKNRVY
ncbi:MAG: ATP cone domain-containing protein [Finegoldia sp.]|nr:ATP cone domain-containing protein [Finegoldia sp.]